MLLTAQSTKHIQKVLVQVFKLETGTLLSISVVYISSNQLFCS